MANERTPLLLFRRSTMASASQIRSRHASRTGDPALASEPVAIVQVSGPQEITEVAQPQPVQPRRHSQRAPPNHGSREGIRREDASSFEESSSAAYALEIVRIPLRRPLVAELWSNRERAGLVPGVRLPRDGPQALWKAL